jgi:cell division protein FtsI/penicillin-binding protein 2
VQVRRVVSEETARTVLRMMYDVVEGQVEGVPPHGARVPGFSIAGKTGTTLVSIPTGYDLDTTIASFVGFAPYEDPRLAILVKIDQPAGGRNLGGEVAAPAFAKMTRDILQYLQIPPTRPTAQVAAR